MSQFLSTVWAARTWLLSGIVPAILVPLFAFGYRKLRRSPPAQLPPVGSQAVPSPPLPAAEAGLNVVSGARVVLQGERELVLPIFDPEKRRKNLYETQTLPCEPPRPEAIIEEIDRAAPLQREERAKHYADLRVRWSGRLTGLSRLDLGGGEHKILVHLTASTGSFISKATLLFVVEELPGWSLIHVGTVFEVSARIESVDDISIKLQDVEILGLR